MALRANAGEDVRITLVAPNERFVYRPLSVREPFALGSPDAIPLDEVAHDLSLDLRRDALAEVRPAERGVRLASGEELAYDSLVVAIGAHRTQAFPHATPFRGHEDAEALRGIVEDLETDWIHGIAFLAPPDTSWTLPLYELALMTARRAHEMCVEVDLALVTPEPQPLAIFGDAAAAAVRELLDGAGIRIECSARATVRARGRIEVDPGGQIIVCDRIVALASVVGIPVRGLPQAHDGFVAVDDHGRVRGVDDVFAAGDGTDFPVKQGGVACQQADAVAEAVAARAGADIEPRPFRPVLRGQLLTGSAPRFLRADLSGTGAVPDGVSDSTLWWPPSKVAGMYLGPYLAGRKAHGPEPVTGVRERVLIVPAAGGDQFEVIGFERDTGP